MKNILTTLLLCISLSVSAQLGVTKFLGIPVDGYKNEMIKKLKAKGFTDSVLGNDMLEGEFNGENVYLSVVTNNNKVYRIAVIDQNPRGETDIKIRFNDLCDQFQNNAKYTPMSYTDYKINKNEDIGYEIIVNDKRYEADFMQRPEITDSIALKEVIKERLLQSYTEEQLSNPSEDIKKAEITAYSEYYVDKLSKNAVWFMISKSLITPTKYTILMYYDNLNNQANGEDL